MSKFKVGDRVVATENWAGAAIKGLYATVRAEQNSGCGVEFDVDFYDEDDPTDRCGHNLHGEISNERGWWIPDEYLELAKEKDPLEQLMEDFAEAVKDLDFLFEQVGRVSEPPKLDATNLIRCIIASKSYPYASLDTTGVLYFYSDLPKGIVVFETTAVKR